MLLFLTDFMQGDWLRVRDLPGLSDSAFDIE